MAELVLGPLLRYVGEREATVWVETSTRCEVDVLGHSGVTWCVRGHHYALVHVDGLEPGGAHPYEVRLDGELRWPPARDDFPASAIRTIDPSAPLRLVFGSCRTGYPHRPPWNLTKDEDPRGREVDALYAYALRMRRAPQDEWPSQLLHLGDQVYADEVSPRTLEFIRTRRRVSEPPGEQVADFEEYTRLYLESWEDPVIRWLLSTVGNSMIFDDHDVHDDWNISRSWVEDARRQPWWEERIAGAFMSYWVYQHVGNLSPRELEEDELFQRVCHEADAGDLLHEFALEADRHTGGSRWSYCRDLGRSKLVMIDSRAGRVLDPGGRSMLDPEEWEWVEKEARGGVDHLLIGTSLPLMLAPALHDVEAWSEATCDGAWGGAFRSLAEKIRRALDLEHWAAFRESFARFAELMRAVGAGERGDPPASIVVLSGDVHHAYLAEVEYPREAGVESPVYQAVCSPMRNPLDARERRMFRLATSRGATRFARGLAASAGVEKPPVSWTFSEEPQFDNQVAELILDGRHARVKIEKTVAGSWKDPRLEVVFDREIA